MQPNSQAVSSPIQEQNKLINHQPVTSISTPLPNTNFPQLNRRHQQGGVTAKI